MRNVADDFKQRTSQVRPKCCTSNSKFNFPNILSTQNQCQYLLSRENYVKYATLKMLSKMYIIAILFLFLSARLLLILSYKCHTNIYIKLNIYTKYIHKVTNKYTSVKILQTANCMINYLFRIFDYN